VEKLVQQLGVERMSKSQVSRLAKSLDQIVDDFRTRPLDEAPYVYVTVDALVVKCREGGRTVNVCVVHAVGVNRVDHYRLGLSGPSDLRASGDCAEKQTLGQVVTGLSPRVHEELDRVIVAELERLPARVDDDGHGVSATSWPRRLG
jgi:hypothetical protein